MNSWIMSALMGRGRNILQMLPQVKANPMGLLMQHNLNIPANIASDPNAILQHLLTTRQITQNQLDQAYQLAQRYK